MYTESVIVLFIFIIIITLTAVAGSAITAMSPWYWNDPQAQKVAGSGVIYSTVWTLLFIVLVLVAFFAYIDNDDPVNKLLVISIVFIYLFLNFAWVLAFFQGKNFAASYAINILMIISLVFLLFYCPNPIIKILLIPNFIWLLFALYMTYKVQQVSP